MSDIDFERIECLLNVAKECGGHSGKLGNIQSAAIGQLIAINDEIKAAAVEDARVTAQAEIDRINAEARANAPEPVEDDLTEKPPGDDVKSMPLGVGDDEPPRTLPRTGRRV